MMNCMVLECFFATKGENSIITQVRVSFRNLSKCASTSQLLEAFCCEALVTNAAVFFIEVDNNLDSA